jgi:hypothetical protein
LLLYFSQTDSALTAFDGRENWLPLGQNSVLWTERSGKFLRMPITPSLMAKRATSECARFTELAPGTTWITALIIVRQRREEKRSALKNGAQRRS